MTDTIVALVVLNPNFKVVYFFEYLGNAVRCTYMCIQILDCICVSVVNGLLRKDLILILWSLHLKLYIYSKSMGPLLACCEKEASGFPDHQ